MQRNLNLPLNGNNSSDTDEQVGGLSHFFQKYLNLIKKFNDATTAGIPSDGIDNAFSQLTSTLQSDEFKEQMNKDFAAAKVELNKIAQAPLNYKRVIPPQKQVSATTDTKATSQKGTTKTTRTFKQISSSWTLVPYW